LRLASLVCACACAAGPAPYPNGTLAMVPCNASDPSQLFTYNPNDR
jgi:hypothetical protein